MKPFMERHYAICKTLWNNLVSFSYMKVFIRFKRNASKRFILIGVIVDIRCVFSPKILCTLVNSAVHASEVLKRPFLE
jgi:hypothetical protein